MNQIEKSSRRLIELMAEYCRSKLAFGKWEKKRNTNGNRQRKRLAHSHFYHAKVRTGTWQCSTTNTTIARNAHNSHIFITYVIHGGSCQLPLAIRASVCRPKRLLWPPDTNSYLLTHSPSNHVKLIIKHRLRDANALPIQSAARWTHR